MASRTGILKQVGFAPTTTSTTKTEIKEYCGTQNRIIFNFDKYIYTFVLILLIAIGALFFSLYAIENNFDMTAKILIGVCGGLSIVVAVWEIIYIYLRNYTPPEKPRFETLAITNLIILFLDIIAASVLYSQIQNTKLQGTEIVISALTLSSVALALTIFIAYFIVYNRVSQFY